MLTISLYESYLEPHDGRAPSPRPPRAGLRAEALESLLLERGLIDPKVVEG